MKITGFRPLIMTKNSESVVKVFEDLGFEIRHTKNEIENGAATNYAMKDANGNRVNVTGTDAIPQDMTAISISVDNFQEAYDFFMSHGFINPRGNTVTDTGSSNATLLLSPSGFAVTISQHIK